MTDETQEEAVEATVEATPEEAAANAVDELLMSLDAAEEEVGMPTEEAAVEEEPQVEATEETPDSDTADQEAMPEDYEKALSALRRDGLPAEVVDQMSQQQVLDYGAKRLKVQADTDNAFRELQEKSTQEEQAAESPAESVPTTQSEPTEQPAAVDLDEAIKPFVDIFGQEAGDALRKATQATQAPPSHLEAQLQYALGALEKQLVSSARSELSGQYPDLVTDDGMQKVNDRMQSLVKTGEYTDINTLMSDAARIELSASKVDAGLANKNRLKASGQPMPSNGADKVGGSMTHEERQTALLDALEEGMDVREATRLYG